MDIKELFKDENGKVSITRVLYDEWLEIEEPAIFSFLTDNEVHLLLKVDTTEYLSPFVHFISIIKVDNSFYKLNGQERKTLWVSGKKTPPKYLIAHVIDMSKTDFMALNSEITRMMHIDKSALGQPNEFIKASYKKLGISLTSNRLKDGFISDAINLALRGKPRALQDKRLALEKEEINIVKALNLFKDNLSFIDHVNPKNEIFISGVLGALLLMIDLRPKTKDFVIRLNNLEGQIKNGLEDPIACLLRAIELNRTSETSAQLQMVVDIYRKTIQAILLWEEGSDSPKYWRKKILSGIDPKPFIREFKSLKQINAIREL